MAAGSRTVPDSSSQWVSPRQQSVGPNLGMEVDLDRGRCGSILSVCSGDIPGTTGENDGGENQRRECVVGSRKVKIPPAPTATSART